MLVICYFHCRIPKFGVNDANRGSGVCGFGREQRLREAQGRGLFERDHQSDAGRELILVRNSDVGTDEISIEKQD